MIALKLEWDWAAAEAGFERALELDPGLVRARESYAELLASEDRLEEALEQLERARELAPLAVSSSHVDSGLVLVWMGDAEGAMVAWKEALELDPAHYTSLINLGAHYCTTGRPGEGLAVLERARELNPETPWVLAEIAACHADAGEVDRTRHILAELEAWAQREYVDAVTLALVHAALREDDAVFRWLERAYEQRAFLLSWVRGNARFARLHSDPRFQDLLHRTGYPGA